jgi:hypothetical protein
MVPRRRCVILYIFSKRVREWSSLCPLSFFPSLEKSGSLSFQKGIGEKKKRPALIRCGLRHSNLFPLRGVQNGSLCKQPSVNLLFQPLEKVVGKFPMSGKIPVGSFFNDSAP